MDPFAVIQTAEAAIKAVHDFAESIKNATKANESLTKKLTSIQRLLNGLQKFCDDCCPDGSNEASPQRADMSQPEHISSLKRLFGDDDQLKNLQDAVENVQKRLDTRQSRARIRSPFEVFSRIRRKEREEKDIKLLLDDLEEFKSSATLALQLATV